jgi:hypothetical protein
MIVKKRAAQNLLYIEVSETVYRYIYSEAFYKILGEKLSSENV